MKALAGLGGIPHPRSSSIPVKGFAFRKLHRELALIVLLLSQGQGYLKYVESSSA
jgi:hypothetical protein